MTPSKQAASGIENLNMESPVKKLNFGTANKENEPLNQTTDTAELKTKIVEESKTVVSKAEEDEPILQENPQRFVLFPIKYHEVSDAF